MAKAKILIVDDDQNILNLLKLRLEAADYHVTVAETGAEAVAFATEESHDLAIVDLRIGDESGINVLEKLLRIQPALPIIIATAHATIDTAVEATKKGGYDYITKPFDMPDLFHRLDKSSACAPLSKTAIASMTLSPVARRCRTCCIKSCRSL
jgi:two-component system response regulator GlrR